MLKKVLIGLGAVVSALVFVAVALLYWPYGATPPDRTPVYAELDFAGAEAKAAELVAAMSLDEKVEQLHGSLDNPLRFASWGLGVLLTPGRGDVTSGYNERLRVPAMVFTDGPRGIAFKHGATAFPVAIARAASFDVELERAVGSAMGVEARRGHYNYLASPCINVLRHPAWGRAQESYGEDPFVNARFGVANVAGIQRHGVMACPKHFALNSIEISRYRVDVSVGERALHEVYLPQFKAMIDSGAASLMSSYNRVRGAYTAENRELLRTILRDQWGFRGFVSSDWTEGLYDAEAGVLAGLDVEMPRGTVYREIPELIERGKLTEARVDTLVRRVVATKLYWTSRPGEPDAGYDGKLSTEDHKRLARRTAEEGIVLLQNEGNPLPLDPRRIRTVLLLGPLADQPNLGDNMSSKVDPESVVTIEAGLRAALGGGVTVDYRPDPDPDDRDLLEAAGAADAVVAVVGYAPNDEGENVELIGERRGDEPAWGVSGDRKDLRLKRSDVALLRALGGRNPNTAAVMIGGSAIVVDEWVDGIPAVLMAWYPGERGGEAVARVLLGRASPGGRMPVSVPREGQRLVHFDPFADTVSYGYLHGYAYHRATEQPARFPFGYGLGYTEHRLDTAYLEAARLVEGDTARLVVRVTNAGKRPGYAVPQAYISWPEAAERPRGVLAAFAKTPTAPGQTIELRLPIPTDGLRNYVGDGAWAATPGDYRVEVGFDAADAAGRPALPFTVE